MKIIRLFVVILIFLVCTLCVSCWKAQLIGSPVNQEALIDGDYEGKFSHGPNSVVAKVTIRNNRITDIKIIRNTGLISGKAVPTIPERIIEQQSTVVDAVSGATNSSNVIMNAVQNAIEKAYKSN